MRKKLRTLAAVAVGTLILMAAAAETGPAPGRAAAAVSALPAR